MLLEGGILHIVIVLTRLSKKYIIMTPLTIIVYLHMKITLDVYPIFFVLFLGILKNQFRAIFIVVIVPK